jgi:hypothetical protein
MKSYRVFALGIAFAAFLGAADRKVVEDGKEKKKEPISAATKYDPKGNIKTNVKVNEAFKTAASNSKKGKEEKIPKGKDESGTPPAAPPSTPKPKTPKP